MFKTMKFIGIIIYGRQKFGQSIHLALIQMILSSTNKSTIYFLTPKTQKKKKKVNTMSDIVPFILSLPSQVPCIINHNLFFQTAKMQC